MKSKDIAVVLVVAFFSAIVSFFASNFLFSSNSSRQQEVEKVDVVTSDFTFPSSKYFNDRAIDPTLPIQIGDNNNPNPFNDTVR